MSHCQGKRYSNPIAHRVRRKRQRPPPSLLIENAWDPVFRPCHLSCPRRFRSRLATIRPSELGLDSNNSTPDSFTHGHFSVVTSGLSFVAAMLGNCAVRGHRHPSGAAPCLANSSETKICIPTVAVREPAQRKPQPSLLRRIASNHGLFGIAPFAVGAVVHCGIESQIAGQHVDVGSLQSDLAI